MRSHGWAVRMNPCYKPTLRFDRLGLLIITKNWIIAHGACANAWM